MKRVWVTIISISLIIGCEIVSAKTGLPLPRFVSLRSSQINTRVGPGRHYPIEWVFVRANYPVELIAEFDNWRKIRDIEGSEGWVHQSMLSGTRYILINKELVALREKPKLDSAPVVNLSRGVITKLLSCQGKWCKLQMPQAKGWVQREDVWGVYTDENIH